MGSTASTHPEIAAEQAHVDRAYARLEALTAAATERFMTSQRVGSFGSTTDSKVNRDAAVASAVTRINEIDIGDLPLCFGRIDTTEDERFHVGRVAVADEDLEPLVVDWRAPVAAPFYRATAREPMGLTRRRQLVNRGRRVVDLDDEVFDDRVFNDTDDEATEESLRGEGALFAALRRSRTGRMGDIVATIQREQDEIIRAPLTGSLVVQGGPGTGKTVVALHRAAYLLYTHRRLLEQRGVLVLGPSRLFLRYIDRVLPALGERTVTLATIPTLVRDMVGELAAEDPAVAHVKGDERMSQVVTKAVRDRQRPLREPLVLRRGGIELRLTRPASKKIIDRLRAASGTHNERRARVERLVLAHFWAQYGAAWREEEPLTEEERPDFESALRADREFRVAMLRMWPVLSPVDLIEPLLTRPALLASATSGVLDDDQRDLLLRESDAPWTDADAPLLDEATALLGEERRRSRPRPAVADFDRARWEAEQIVDDHFESPLRGGLRDAVLARLTAVGSPPTDDGPPPLIRSYGHVIVDEAQDLSPMAWRMVARRCPSGSMTVLGDLGQASRGWAAADWGAVMRHFPGLHEPHLVELSVNYRTPTEIMDLAARVLAAAAPGLRPPRSVRDDGVQPRVMNVAPEQLARAAAEAAREMAEELGEGRIAVIVPAEVEAEVAALLPSEADVLDRPIAVMSVDLVKGLEFDGVVVVGPARIVASADAGLRGLYVALTRATRRLSIVHAEPLPEALAARD